MITVGGDNYLVSCIRLQAGYLFPRLQFLWRDAFDIMCYTQGDSDVISMPAGFRRHLVGKTLRSDITEILFVGKLMIVQTFS